MAVAMCLPNGASLAQQEPQNSLGDCGVQVVELMKAGEFEAIHAMFDENLAGQVSAKRLAAGWAQVRQLLGEFQEHAEVVLLKRVGDYLPVQVPCRFERGWVSVQVSFDPQGKIAGIFIRPTTTAPGSQPAPPEWLREEPVTVGQPPWELEGLLTLPPGQGPFPAVVLVHGSGPNDRDETLLANKPFRDLAWGLAQRGVGVLRYDKRTLTHGAAMMADPRQLTVQTEVIDDALAAANLLRQRPEVDPQRVFVLGHSLGGMMVPRILKQDPKLAGGIVMAGAVHRPLPDLLVAQVRYVAQLDGTLDPQEATELAQLEVQARRAQAPDLAPAEMILMVPGAYWLDLREYDAAALAASLPQPMLILQGLRDYQIPGEDLTAWREALAEKPNARFKTYAELGHLFMPAGDPPSPADYAKPGRVSDEVIADLAAWVHSQTH